MELSADIQPLQRSFVPSDFTITTWEKLQPYFEKLTIRALKSKADLEHWLLDVSELDSVVSEDFCWRQIKMTQDTTDKTLEESFSYFCTDIQPHIQPYTDQINKKLISSPFLQELDPEKYFTYLRAVKNKIALFREANIPLQSELSLLQQEYGGIAGKMSVEVDGKEYTLQQAAKFLESSDRHLRESVWRKIWERRSVDRDAMDKLYTTLVVKRNQVALNAGFDNYRDYAFKELGRFDYTPENCDQFHEGVKEYVMPLIDEILRHKKAALKIDTLRPWDLDAEPEGQKPLHPFQTGTELLEKATACFQQLKPYFADCLRKMDSLHHFDLDSRKGKAPGGYNCPLAESGAPFIFMNAAGQMSDVTTIVHEGGHAIQSFLTHSLELNAFKEYPMEIAEVASMSMELMSMKYWSNYFPDEADFQRAKIQQLERCLTIFPWIATIDKFQHWIYLHPQHTTAERTAAWEKIFDEFTSKEMDYSGLEKYKSINWQRQLHLFEVPFYYIEYGIAQLGAIGVWKQFQENEETTMDKYIHALSLGGTKTLPELYAAAGLRFDFSPSHIKGLSEYIFNQWKTAVK